ncbi:leucyl aminopeptidase family protein [Albimonas pacifica]|uniref:Leucyl aminopeptidase n=1 Tax=Albimonas pacifica TaxID=1114924 RepID=A0A1I3BUA9_9RHOB|nr:leucyl aminopeptidase family protein [Albimonas pacifica]SFH65894.1 leucyl aminopeptidase [Albimonas pacifica]
MTDPAPLPRADRLVVGEASDARPLRLVAADGLDRALGALDPAQRAWVEATGFRARLGQLCLVPGPGGAPGLALFGHGDAAARARSRFDLGRAAAELPEGTWRLEAPEEHQAEAALGWLLSRTRFDRYRKGAEAKDVRLAVPETLDAERLHRIADGVALTRWLIDTPANDMGPAEIEAAARALAAEQGAEVSSIVGDALLEANFPLVHAVGRAAAPGREPRVIDLTWGDPDAPKVTLVGKGIAFDTGGLNLKPGASMGLMKKDMGGAANVLGLARMVMAQGLPVRLRVLVASAENAVSSASFRPGDILTSRKGLTVEINNTDAEGRLVLADALALADEESPDVLLCWATLTGAARVALGPELPPFFTDDQILAMELTDASHRVRDPLWRMPFWPGYEEKIEPGIADLDNAPSGGMAGAITAALFLRRFVENARAFAHFDIYGWTQSTRPGRPKGGEAMGARAAFAVLSDRHKA